MIPLCDACKTKHMPESLNEDFCTDCEDCHCLDCGHVVLNPCTCSTECYKGSKLMPMDSPEAKAKAIREPILNKFYFEGSN
jgi:hypothetical protein